MSLKKYIPDFITCLNLVCGVSGIVFAFKGRFDVAFPLMLAGALFDFLDGLAARLLDAYSPLGKELDSLCDVVTFGVLPSVMLYNLACICSFGESIWCWTPLLIAVFSALRLAKFNVDERQHESFLGLPTPACAMLSGAICYFVASSQFSFLADWCAGPVFIPVYSVVMSALLVCEIPMFSIKFGGAEADRTTRIKRITFFILVAASIIVTVLMKWNWSAIVLLVMTIYIVKNLIYAIQKI